MLKDIDFRKVEEIAIAVIPEEDAGEQVWNAYLINTGDTELNSILVNSRGYGEVNDKAVKTSQLRQFFEVLAPNNYVKIEEIREELLQLNNEFWVSYSKGNYLFDKKYIFVIEALREDHLIEIPVINKKGVLIK